ARERANFHRAKVRRDDALAAAGVVLDEAEVLPALVLLDLALGLVAANLLIQGVKKLLPRRRAGKGGAVVERPAEAAEVDQPFRRAVEGDAHAVEQVDDVGRGVAHALDERLVREEIAALDRVDEVDLGVVALALRVDR